MIARYILSGNQTCLRRTVGSIAHHPKGREQAAQDQPPRDLDRWLSHELDMYHIHIVYIHIIYIYTY